MMPYDATFRACSYQHEDTPYPSLKISCASKQGAQHYYLSKFMSSSLTWQLNWSVEKDIIQISEDNETELAGEFCVHLCSMYSILEITNLMRALKLAQGRLDKDYKWSLLLKSLT